MTLSHSCPFLFGAIVCLPTPHSLAPAVLVCAFRDFILELQNENGCLSVILLYMLTVFRILLEIFLERKCRHFHVLAFFYFHAF